MIPGRTLLSRILLLGALLSVFALVLIALNLVQGPPLYLRRFREVSLALYGFLLLALIVGPHSRDRFRYWASQGLRLLSHRRFLPIAAGALLVLYLLSTLTRHLAFQTYSHDFAMIDEALFQSHQGTLMYSPVLGRSFFSEHFSPILLALVPLHWIWSSPYLLLTAQALALWGSGLLLRRILVIEGQPLWIANLGFVLWLNHPFVVKTLEYVAHMESFLPILVFGTYLAYRRRNRFLYVLLALASLSVKEDVGLYMIGFGAWAILQDRRRIEGSLTILVGLAWALASLEIVIPAFASDDLGFRFLDRWGEWGDGFLGIAVGYLTHPAELLGALLQKAPLRLFGCLLFLPFLSRWGWLLFVIPWIVNTTSAHPQQSGLSLYYGIPLATFAVLAAIGGMRSHTFRSIARTRSAPVLVIALIVLNIAHFKYYPIERARPAFLEALEMIPEGEPVEAMACFYPVLGYDRTKRFIGNPPRLSERFVVLRDHSSTWPLSEADAAATVRTALASNRYKTLFEINGCYLLEKRIEDSHEP